MDKTLYSWTGLVSWMFSCCSLGHYLNNLKVNKGATILGHAISNLAVVDAKATVESDRNMILDIAVFQVAS